MYTLHEKLKTIHETFKQFYIIFYNVFSTKLISSLLIIIIITNNNQRMFVISYQCYYSPGVPGANCREKKSSGREWKSEILQEKTSNMFETCQNVAGRSSIIVSGECEQQ